MDDEIPMGSWSIAPEMRHAMRLDRVRTAMASGDYDEAILEAEEFLDEVPRHAEALYLLGDALLETGDAELARQALEACERAQTEPPSVDLLYRLGLSAFETCDATAAIENLREVTRLEPAHAEAHFTLGLSLEVRAAPGDVEASQASFAMAQALDPDSYPPPMQLTPADWQSALREALQGLPAELAVVIDQVPITLVDQPDIKELRASSPVLPPTTIALLDGDPGEDEVVKAPTGMRVFTRTLSRYPTFDDVVDALRHAIAMEAADWLGVQLA